MHVYNVHVHVCVYVRCQARLQSGQTGIHTVASIRTAPHILVLSGNEYSVMKYAPVDKHQLEKEEEKYNIRYKKTFELTSIFIK